MRNALLGLTCLSLMAAASHAAEITVFYATTDDLSTPPAVTNPTVNVGETVYLWAEVAQGDVWNGMGILFSELPTAGSVYNPSILTANRWESASDFDPTDGEIWPVAVVEVGLGDYVNDPLCGPATDPCYFLLGEMAFGAPGDVYMSQGAGGFVVAGGGDVFVRFGAGDTYVTTEILPDLHVVPEPAGLLVLTLASLVIRRR